MCVAGAAGAPACASRRADPPNPTVDRLCRTLFLTPGARAQDDNLLFVRERLLRDEEEQASLLDLYAKVRAGKRVPMDETKPLIERLRLSGIVRAAVDSGVSDGRLLVRNRIYERVFDRKWIADHMPGAELRRQRAAYRRGLARSAAVAAVVVAGMASLAIMAARQAGRARIAEAKARVAEADARAEARRNSRLLYDANMALVQQTRDAGNIGRVRQLLDETRLSPDRGFEWSYWQKQSQLHVQTLRGHQSRINGLAFSPDGRQLVTGSQDQTAVVWPPRRGSPWRRTACASAPTWARSCALAGVTSRASRWPSVATFGQAHHLAQIVDDGRKADGFEPTAGLLVDGSPDLSLPAKLITRSNLPTAGGGPR